MTEGRCGYLSNLALLAGEGLLPLAIAKALSSRGVAPTVIALGKVNPLLEDFADRILEIPQISITKILGLIERVGCRRLVLAGSVPKRLIFGGAGMDRETLEWVLSLPSRDDHALLGAIVRFFESRGLEVVSYRSLIPGNIAEEGKIAGREPSEAEWEDIRYGIGIAREVVRLSFGQALAVKAGSVVAVEAMEGTDEMIGRAGRIGPGGIVVKMMRSDQDERFDLPTVGPQTLECMAASGMTCLAVEAGRTVVLDRESFESLAEAHSISVTGFLP
ncbi:MAG: LpxI family protein [Synergistales bacterium]